PIPNEDLDLRYARASIDASQCEHDAGRRPVRLAVHNPQAVAVDRDVADELPDLGPLHRSAAQRDREDGAPSGGPGPVRAGCDGPVGAGVGKDRLPVLKSFRVGPDHGGWWSRHPQEAPACDDAAPIRSPPVEYRLTTVDLERNRGIRIIEPTYADQGLLERPNPDHVSIGGDPRWMQVRADRDGSLVTGCEVDTRDGL